MTMLEQIQMPQAAQALDTRGACFAAVIRAIREATSENSARLVQRRAAQVVLHAIKSYQKAFGGNDVGQGGTGRVSRKREGEGVPPGINGLMYGRVQSGKTNTSIATVALASGNGFKFFVILTSDNTWLGKQTADRYRDQLGAGDGPIVRSWEDWRADPQGFAKSVQAYVEDTGIALVSTKNTNNLESLALVLKYLGADRVPGMIIDDEADNASLNTQTARMASGKTTEPSKIFALIGDLRALMPNHVFIQVTATPQSLLLQGLPHPLRPAWVVMVEPGEDYIGGTQFYEQGPSPIVFVEGTELDDLRSGKINPGDSWTIPKGLAQAVCCFVTGTALRQLEQGSAEILSMLIHIDHRKVSHKAVRDALTKYLLWLDQALRGKLKDSDRRDAEKQVSLAYEELRKTNPDMPPEKDVLEKLRSNLRNAHPEIIDADNPNRKPEYRSGMNFLIGGNRLGRGVTIEGLTVTYYGRDAKKKMMDTVHQHARMFGYRKHLLPVTRLYSAEHIVGALKDIHQSDEATRTHLEADGKLAVKPVWVGRELTPTRSSVLNPADLTAMVGGRAIWPPGIVHSSKIRPLVEELDSLLSEFDDPKKYYEVPIDFLSEILAKIPSDRIAARSWDDERIKQLLAAMKLEPVKISKARLNVRRGRYSDEGYRVAYDKQQESGFAEGSQINEARDTYPGVPVLLLRKQAGRKEEGWKGQPFYAPTLIIPKTKFAFVFVKA